MITLTREEAQQVLLQMERARIFVITRERIKIPEGIDLYDEAIETLRARLEQPEKKQEPVATLFGSLPVYDTASPQQQNQFNPDWDAMAVMVEEQEPVAWRTFDGEGGYDYRDYELNEDYGHWWEERHPNHKNWVDPLYTAPPPQQNQFNPDWDAMAVMVEEQQRMAKEIEELKAALKEQEPVAWQSRMRPDWEENGWTQWKDCPKEQAYNFWKTSRLNDWVYEARELYTAPPQRPWVGLTDEDTDEAEEVGAREYRRWRSQIRGQTVMPQDRLEWHIYRAIEAKIKEKNEYRN